MIREDWNGYIAELKERMRLNDWTLRLKLEDKPRDGDNAEIHSTHGRKLAVLLLSDAFLADKPEDQRHTIVHELVHMHFFGLTDLMEARGDMDSAARMLVELGVDAMADVLAPFMPLP